MVGRLSRCNLLFRRVKEKLRLENTSEKNGDQVHHHISSYRLGVTAVL